MTIDIATDSKSKRSPDFKRAEVTAAVNGLVSPGITDIVVVFGGWGSQRAGEQLKGTATATAKLAENVRGMKQPGHELVVLSYEGELGQGKDDVIERVFMATQRSFHPLGKLIVYGYSAGGFNAHRLSYKLGISHPYYDVSGRRFTTMVRPTDKQTCVGPFGFNRIDLMITVDAASGPSSSTALRRIWPSVRYNLNIYQLHDSPIWSHGGPNTAVDSQATAPIGNHDWSNKYVARKEAAHGLIAIDSNSAALEAICSELAR